MKKLTWSQKLGLWVGAIIAIGLLAALAVGASNIWTDYQWYASLGQQSVFWGSFLSQAIVWVTGTAIGFALMYVSARSAWRVVSEKQRFGKLTAFACLLITGLMAWTMSQQWMVLRLAISQSPFGLTDPQFGKDVGFFVFTLPALEMLLRWASGLIILTMVAVAAVVLSSRIKTIGGIPPRWERLKTIGFRLVGVLMLTVSFGYWLATWQVVYSTRGGFAGASYSDVYAQLPANWILVGLSVVMAVLLFVTASRRRWWPAVVSFVVYFVLATILGSVWPSVVQTYIASPNEATLNQTYRERNISMTRAAFDLSSVTGTNYPASESLSASTSASTAKLLSDATIWTPSSVQQAFTQLQTIRTYYQLSNIDFDRYEVNGQLRQVLVAAREITSTGLPSSAQTWVNTHLVYTHGYGLAISSASQTTSEGLPTFFVGDVPSVVSSDVAAASPSLNATQPRIYFGPDMSGYAIVNTKLNEFDYPMGTKNATSRYTANGVAVGSFFSRCAWALRLQSYEVLLSNYIKPTSQVLLYRGIVERATKLAPWLQYDSNPYAAIVDGRVVWILDAYTSSDHFPYSQPLANGTNYLRNSVKVVVDAYTGAIKFYAYGNDPIRDAWSRIFPTLISPQSDMSADLAKHIRVPKTLESTQAQVYRTYHMTDPTVFYNTEDLWQITTDASGTPVPPSYVMLSLPDANGKTTAKAMYLLQPYSLPNRDNLVGWMATSCEPDDYGRRTVYLLPKDRVVLGQKQVAARINQDPNIAQQLTLWNQPGTNVVFGSMLVLPVEGTVAYVQPLFLQAQNSAITQLVSVIVVNGDRVVFDKTLSGALAKAYGTSASSTETSTTQ
jgi:uncharacterized membrane protein (UPF0182 family)